MILRIKHHQGLPGTHIKVDALGAALSQEGLGLGIEVA